MSPFGSSRAVGVLGWSVVDFCGHVCLWTCSSSNRVPIRPLCGSLLECPLQYKVRISLEAWDHDLVTVHEEVLIGHGGIKEWFCVPCALLAETRVSMLMCWVSASSFFVSHARAMRSFVAMVGRDIY